MAQQTIAVGTSANDGTGDTLRAAFQKANANFTELYGGSSDAELAAIELVGDRIDQEGHVVVDQRDPHEAAGGAFAQRLDRDTGLAGLARIGGAAKERGGGSDRRLIKSLALAGQGALCQDAFQRRANS